MLIGILGEAGSGKDAVCFNLVKDHRFYSLALADPMKVYCQWMFGWPSMMLWGSSERRAELDEQFFFNKCPTCGRHEGIRDPDGLGPTATWRVCAFCKTATPLEQLKTPVSPRYTLQNLGDWARGFRADAYVAFVLKRAQAVLGHRPCDDPLWRSLQQAAMTGYRWFGYEDDGVGRVVISDVRMTNEVAGIRNAGGKVYRVKRDQVALDQARATLAPGIPNHVSEVQQRNIPDDALDGVINNDGTLEDLKQAVTALIHGQE